MSMTLLGIVLVAGIYIGGCDVVTFQFYRDSRRETRRLERMAADSSPGGTTYWPSPLAEHGSRRDR